MEIDYHEEEEKKGNEEIVKRIIIQIARFNTTWIGASTHSIVCFFESLMCIEINMMIINTKLTI